MIGLNEMFFEEGDQDMGSGSNQAVFGSSYKSKFAIDQAVSTYDIERAKNCAGDIDLPPLPK